MPHGCRFQSTITNTRTQPFLLTYVVHPCKDSNNMMTKVEQKGQTKESSSPAELERQLSSPEKRALGKSPRWVVRPHITKDTSERREEEAEATQEEEDHNNFLLSQVSLSLSQTDETIRRLEKEGELEHVVGSQSMLSQELILSSQRTEDDDEVYHQGFQLSQEAESSTAMARRLGLLSQDVKEESLDFAAAPPCHATAVGLTMTQSTTMVAFAAAGPVVSMSTDPKTPPAAVRATTITDTPFRESECFSSLLEAVDKITKDEELNAKMLTWQHNTIAGSDGDYISQNPQEGSIQGACASKRKLPTSIVEQKSGSPSSPSSLKKSRKSTLTRKKEEEQREAQDTAKRAATLAERTITEPEMAKKLLLSMALVRENPRSVPSVLPAKGSVVPEGFFWAHYPPLEAVLKKHMAEYYDLSTTKCQSAQQQAFNNDLVVLVRDVANERGWKFHQTFTDKGLRDRIRCYYKTHIQNAKKRLRTMVRNPTKRANARHLCAHLDLIEKHGTDNPDGSFSYGHFDDDGDDDNYDDAYIENGHDKDINDETTASSQAAPVKSEPTSHTAVFVGV